MGISDLIGQFSPDELAVNASSLGIEFPAELTAKISRLLDIGKILAIVMIIYFIFLIIKQLVALRDSHNLRVIAKNTSEINDKLGKKKGSDSEDKKK